MATVVGRPGEIAPGEMKLVTVDGQAVGLANVEGKIYAFGDLCAHAGCNLSDGGLAGTVVLCPCHGSEFDVTNGSVVSGPARTPVKSYTVTVAGDEIQVSD